MVASCTLSPGLHVGLLSELTGQTDIISVGNMLCSTQTLLLQCFSHYFTSSVQFVLLCYNQMLSQCASVHTCQNYTKNCLHKKMSSCFALIRKQNICSSINLIVQGGAAMFCDQLGGRRERKK